MKVFKPFKHQPVAINHILNNDRCGVLLDMGLGKTVITLTAFKELLYNFDVARVLIIAPKNVVLNVWLQECEEWEHLNCLKGIRVIGDEKQRIKALNTQADFHVIGVDSVAWLVNHYKTKFPFDAVIIDELSKFKSSNSQRFRALKMVIPKAKRVVGLTGTPAPNGLIDIWAQMYLIDGGERLGKTISEYRNKYFNAGAQNNYVVYKYELKKKADKVIYNKIKDICISMSSEDYLKLAPVTNNKVFISMPGNIQEQYTVFEKEQVLSIGTDKITAVNAAVLTNKLLQFANGAVYDANRKVHQIHNLKLDALEELIDEAQGKNILLAYSFKHDIDNIKKRFKFVREFKTTADQFDWNKGKIKLLACHPASAGHGLNLQYGGHVGVWFGMNWSLELTQQFNKRLHRPGQANTVLLNYLLLKNTMDEEVFKSLIHKDGGQRALLDAVKVIIDKYK